MVIIAIVLTVLLLLTALFVILGKRQINQLNKTVTKVIDEELNSKKSSKNIHEQIAESLAERQALVEMFNAMMEADTIEKPSKTKKSKK